MNLSQRDRRALAYLAVAAIFTAVVYFWPENSASAVVPAASSVDVEQKRLAKLRDTAATVPSKEEILKQLQVALSEREKGLIQGETAAQAQAQLLQILRRLCASESPGIEIRSTDLGPVAALGDAYGTATVGIQIECRIEQLVNLLAAISQQPELLATTNINITSNNAKEKIVAVHLTVSGAVPRRLVPNNDKGAAL